jgi:hypothetical protein
MIDIEIPMRRVKCMSIHHVYFAERPRTADCFKPALYFHSSHPDPLPGWTWRRKYTLLVDLSRDAETILGGCSTTTRYEIRKGEHDGFRFEPVPLVDEYMGFYNEAAARNRMQPMDRRSLDPYWPHLLVTKVLHEGQPLAMHAHLADPGQGRAHLYQSASTFRAHADRAARNLIGRANRWLHFRDMLHFKEAAGFGLYDFGGLAEGSTDEALKRIDAFKRGFGGRMIETSNYYSLPIQFIHWLRT